MKSIFAIAVLLGLSVQVHAQMDEKILSEQITDIFQCMQEVRAIRPTITKHYVLTVVKQKVQVQKNGTIHTFDRNVPGELTFASQEECEAWVEAKLVRK